MTHYSRELAHYKCIKVVFPQFVPCLHHVTTNKEMSLFEC